LYVIYEFGYAVCAVSVQFTADAEMLLASVQSLALLAPSEEVVG
jgi:hypothetical protein